MSESERIRRALAPLHASENTLEEVLDMIGRDETYARRTGRRAMRTALIAAAVAAALSVAAYAAGEYTGFFDTVFGDRAIAGWDTEHMVYTDADGNVWEQYDLPGQERTPADPEAAQALVGDSTASVDRSVTVGDVTYTVKDIVVDEHGMGALTYVMDDPNGFPGMTFDGGIMQYDPYTPGSQMPPVLASCDADGNAGRALSCVEMVSADGTDTRRTVAVYFAPLESMDGAAALRLSFGVVTGYDPATGAVEQKWGGVVFPLSGAAQATALTGPGGWSADISPLGLQIAPPAENPYGQNYYFNDLVIHMTDGTQYVLKQEEPYMRNTPAGCYEGEKTNFVFNRLIDPEQVTAVTALGKGSGERDGQPVHDALDLTFTK